MCNKKVTVLYEDAALWVCLKPAGVSSQDEPGGVPSLLRVHAGRADAYVGVIHRLDMGVGGVMVYAKQSRAAAALSAAVQAHALQKQYLAVVHGIPEPAEGEMCDLLFKDCRTGKTFIVDRPRKGVRDAALSYRVLAGAEGLSLCAVTLHTGRSHQIRVQFASRKLPLAGDGRYGARDNANGIALWSYRLAFSHPDDGRPLVFCALPQGGVWDTPALQNLLKGWTDNESVESL